MAKPARTLTAELMSDFHYFFVDLLEEGPFESSRRLDTAVVGLADSTTGKRQHDALQALRALSPHKFDHDANYKRVDVSPEELARRVAAHQAWLNEYVTPKGWQQFLANRRQSKFKSKHRYERTSLKVSSMTGHFLRQYAEQHQLTVDAAVRELMKKAGLQVF